MEAKKKSSGKTLLKPYLSSSESVGGSSNTSYLISESEVEPGQSSSMEHMELMVDYSPTNVTPSISKDGILPKNIPAVSKDGSPTKTILVVSRDGARILNKTVEVCATFVAGQITEPMIAEQCLECLSVKEQKSCWKRSCADAASFQITQ